MSETSLDSITQRSESFELKRKKVESILNKNNFTYPDKIISDIARRKDYELTVQRLIQEFSRIESQKHTYFFIHKTDNNKNISGSNIRSLISEFYNDYI